MIESSIQAVPSFKSSSSCFLYAFPLHIVSLEPSVHGRQWLQCQAITGNDKHTCASGICENCCWDFGWSWFCLACHWALSLHPHQSVTVSYVGVSAFRFGRPTYDRCSRQWALCNTTQRSTGACILVLQLGHGFCVGLSNRILRFQSCLRWYEISIFKIDLSTDVYLLGAVGIAKAPWHKTAPVTRNVSAFILICFDGRSKRNKATMGKAA